MPRRAADARVEANGHYRSVARSTTDSLKRRDFLRIAGLAVGSSLVSGGGGLGRVLGAEPASYPPKLPTKDVPWLAEVQLMQETRRRDAPALKPVLVDAQNQPIDTLHAWEKRRGELRAAWEQVLRPLPVERAPAPKWTVLDEARREGVIQRRIRYETEPGQVVEAYLLTPEKLAGRAPGVAVFHSTANHSIRQPVGLGDDREKAFGLHLAKRGCVTLSPRNFLCPNNDKIAPQTETDGFFARHPQSTGMARMLLDCLVAVDLLAALPEVDAGRLGCVGHSLGAKQALYLPAFDDRVRVSVSSEGGVGIPFSNWDAPWYLGQQVHSPDFAREHHELLALIAPRPFLLVGGDSADGDKGWPYLRAAYPAYDLYGQPTRLGLFNHRKGHAVPPEAEERIAEWMTTYLEAGT